MLVINIPELIQSSYARFSELIFKLDQKLADRYGDQYSSFKQRFSHAKNWYEKEKSEAKSNGAIPLEEKQSEIIRQIAEAGSAAAQKEKAIKVQLKELWHALRNI